MQRDLLDQGVFQDAGLLQVWMYCQLKATYRQVEVPVGRERVTLEPGQLLYGRKAVSQRLNITEGKLRSAIDRLERMGLIQVESHRKYSIVTITDWQEQQQTDSLQRIQT